MSWLEVRSPEAERLAEQDLELELYRRGKDLNLTLGWCDDLSQLWHGSQPLWMDASTSQHCQPPPNGPYLKSLSRRLCALLTISQDL